MRRNITRVEDIVARLGFDKVSDLWVAHSAFENWYDLVLNKFKLKGKFTARVRREKAEIDEKRRIATFKAGGKRVRFYYRTEGQLVDSFYTFAELFERGDYRGIDARDRKIVDVGANIGDSAMYFAMMGAKHVYAFEPYPFACNTAKKNVKLNGLGKKITMLNEGCGGKDGSIRVDADYEASIGSEISGSKRNGKLVKMRSLDTIVKKYKIRKGGLKLDCEGCEYGLILRSSDNALMSFDRIMMEYHFGYLDLEKKLRGCGFEVSHSPPRIEFGHRRVRIGLLLAVRKPPSR